MKIAQRFIPEIDESLPLTSTITTNTNALQAHVGGLNEVTSTSDITITIRDYYLQGISVSSVLTYVARSTGNILISYGNNVTGDAGRTYKMGDVITLWHKSHNVWEIIRNPIQVHSTTLGETMVGATRVSNIVTVPDGNYVVGSAVSGTLYITY